MVAVGEPEESLALNDVRSQLLRFVDLFIWTALLGIFYYVWSDLVTVVSYLREITLCATNHDNRCWHCNGKHYFI
ncbi:N6-adenine-specific DNA methylase [Haemophilus influenzae PittII]|nr:N6-adenine-specific DNA methylase [Haemophilus influenzae PittII]